MTSLRHHSRHSAGGAGTRRRLGEPRVDGYRGGGRNVLRDGLTLYVVPAVYSYLSKEHRAARVEETFEMAGANGVKNGTRG